MLLLESSCDSPGSCEACLVVIVNALVLVLVNALVLVLVNALALVLVNALALVILLRQNRLKC